MILDTPAQETAINAPEVHQEFVAMLDLDLMYVGGGGAGAILF